MQKKAFFFKNIWSYQKKAVPLHPLLKKKHVFLAQLVEQLTLNQWVQGSSPWEDTKGYPKRYPFFVLQCGLEPSNNIGLPKRSWRFRKSGGIECPNDDEIFGQCTRLPNACTWEDTKDTLRGVLCVAYKQISLFYFIGSV